MLQTEFIKKNKLLLEECLLKRRLEMHIPILNEIIQLDDTRKELQYELDNNLSIIKRYSKDYHANSQESLTDETVIAKEKIKNLKKKINDIQTDLEIKLCLIPNTLHSRVPVGSSADDNQTLFCSTLQPLDNITYRPHWELIREYDIVDFELGNKIVGQGFPFYKGKGAKLQRALANFLLDNAIAEGYEEIIPSILVNKNSAYGTGQLPDMENQMYEILGEDKFLIPTSEVPLTNIVSGEIINFKSLPIKYTAHTQCFRKEAGSWGSKVRGLNRLHQFEKIELVQISTAEDSYDIFDTMLKYLYRVLDKLEIPYRTLNLCSGDIGFKAALQYDIEAWSFAQKQWLEISSLSNFESFQSNRMNIRYRDNNNKIQYAHTLNGSAFGMSRLLAVIIENHQQANWLNIPKALISYTGFSKIEKKI